ncbi:MAG: hypothetical protein K8L99_10800 [Anaerolineae bacterium]|nr:hypothetical protein [Anaerolineae bacterium]
MGVFIEIEIDQSQMTLELGSLLERLCPVDIFELKQGELTIKLDNEDECTLCGLCLQAAPPAALRIHKTYNGETLVSTGEG